jgi:hypothetical protein
MGKSVHNDVLDAALNYIKDNATRIAVCSTEPTTYTELITTNMLSVKTISSSDFTGPADGDTNGRKITSNQHANVSVTNSGTAQHVGLGDSANSKLLLVTTCTSQVLTAGNTVTIPAWDDEIADPS